MSKPKRKPAQAHQYSMFDVLMASTTQPFNAEKQRHQLTRMWGGLAALETAAQPTSDDWRVVSDAVNLMETLTLNNRGHWLDADGDVVHITDTSGLLADAVTAMGQAGERAMRGQPLRLSAAGITACRAVLEDYRDLLATLPARTMMQVHRETEKRIRNILAGRGLAHDVVVVDF